MSQIAGRLDRSATGRLLNLVATSEAENIDDSNDESASLLALIKSSPGNVSLESMMTETDKLKAFGWIRGPSRESGTGDFGSRLAEDQRVFG